MPIRPKGITKRNEISRWQRREEKEEKLNVNSKNSSSSRKWLVIIQTDSSRSTSSARGTSISDNILYIYMCYMHSRSMNITNLFIYIYNVHTHDMHFWRSSSLSLPSWSFLLLSRFKFKRFVLGNLQYTTLTTTSQLTLALTLYCPVVPRHIIRETAVTFCIQLNSVAGVMVVAIVVVVVICCRPL